MVRLISIFLTCIIISSCLDIKGYYGTHYSGNSPSILFIGDSRINWMKLDNYFDNEMWNYGKAGYTTGDVINYTLHHISSLEPDIYMLSIGINDFLRNTDEITVLNNLSKIFDFLTMRIPAEDIYVTGIVPSGYINTENINGLIQIECINRGLQYIDISPISDFSGYLLSTYTYDSLHYNAQGNITFTDLIKNAMGL